MRIHLPDLRPDGHRRLAIVSARRSPLRSTGTARSGSTGPTRAVLQGGQAAGQRLFQPDSAPAARQLSYASSAASP
jgi:hypothetical protein